jgi:hypothetical protein
MSRQQVVALAILGIMVIAVYALVITMAADVLQMGRTDSQEPTSEPPTQELLSSPYPPTWPYPDSYAGAHASAYIDSLPATEQHAGCYQSARPSACGSISNPHSPADCRTVDV